MTPYTLSEDQIVAAQRAHWLANLRKPRRFGFLISMTIVLIAAYTLANGLSSLLEALGLALLFFLAFPFVFVRFGLRRNARKLLATTPNFQGEQHLTVRDDGLTGRNTVSSWHHGWPAFRGYRLLPTTVSLYLSDQSFYVLPRASLEPGELALITSHLSAIG